ncbi:MAG TPA: DUF86 domain-containing protein [Caldisericia bacterium]|nr:DUF86 domain-containing protein [Caldisericia bacterium]HPB34262.1 DUF86 domain-containing protein [Caldisericia bacterium]HQL65941.1 DUF86 domain-containing protein [Caldisericia bacterium]HQN48278.1 DUF86 domain-containing protein [Caldisericia bacterium]HQO99640.1 DUF86 domain-containing protein [Caldisericia bacterium]
MKRNIKLYLQDIWESILSIEEYTKNFTEDEFNSNRQVQDAVIRRLEIIGEAVKNIDDDFRDKYPQIPWKKIAAIRDIIAHEYFGVKLERVWDVIIKDLPGLRDKIKAIMEEEDVR